MTPESRAEEGSGQKRPTHESRELIEHRLNEIEAAAKETRSDLKKLLGYFEGPDGLWSSTSKLDEKVDTLRRDTTNLQKDIETIHDDVKGLNNTRNKIIGGFVALSAVIGLLIAILRFVPADPPKINVTVPERMSATTDETD